MAQVRAVDKQMLARTREWLLKRRDGKGHGDQLVKLKVVLPSRIDSELEEFMQRWRERMWYL